MDILLSLLITSHNQGKLLEQCVNSILAQFIPFGYEIVISDDCSTDGTWDIAKSLSEKYPVVKAIQCDTDSFNPLNRCQRCGWNQCHAYRNSKGKYFAHIDADDFFLEGTEVLRKQVELLEQHPECSCCMANNFWLNEGEGVDEVKLEHSGDFKTGQILPSEDYVRNYWRIDHAFVYRRYRHEDPTELFGGYYDDTLITSYHVQFGDIVCLDDAGYVYVKYEKSIWQEVVATEDHLLLCPVVYIPNLLPSWSNAYYSSQKHICQLLVATKLVYSGFRLQEENYAYLNGLPRTTRLICLMNQELSLWGKCYLILLIFILKSLKHASCKPLYWLLSVMMK